LAANVKTLPKYVPGVCNIGPAERAARRRSGIFGLVIAFILLAFLLAIHAPRAWRLIVFLPAAGAASGFIQDTLHFCAGFGLKGLYNVANSLGKTDTVTQLEYRRQDKRKALRILYLSLLVGLVFAALAFWL